MDVRAAPRGGAVFCARPRRGVRSFGLEGEAGGGHRPRRRRQADHSSRGGGGRVGRVQSLRGDVFPMNGSVVARCHSTGVAVTQGKAPRPIEAYWTRRRQGEVEREVTEDRMVDGHPRAAMATRLGQDSPDARAVDHRVRAARPAGPGGAGAAPGSTRRPPGSARATAPLSRAGAHRRPDRGRGAAGGAARSARTRARRSCATFRTTTAGTRTDARPSRSVSRRSRRSARSVKPAAPLAVMPSWRGDQERGRR